MITHIKKLIPQPIFLFFQPYYHQLVSWLAAVVYRFPSRRLTVVGVTGTNGKSTVVELLSEIIEEAGYRVASVSSIRFRIADREKINDKKMTMPGRFFLQQFLRRAVRAGCTHVVLEVTSEGIKQYRHKHIKFDVAVITNITPEHIESHGSFEAYRAAKAELFRVSPVHIVNADDEETFFYLSKISSTKQYAYKERDFPKDIELRLAGEFNRTNANAALTTARALGIGHEPIVRALERIDYIPGRLEVLQEKPFGVVVDYAHTPDALERVYNSFSAPRLLCVLGAAGGGRDTWKRPEMGRIAARYCRMVILTNEDPYDESPEHILGDIEKGLFQAGMERLDYRKIPDRRQAIHEALQEAKKGDVVVITGKGCEPWMMGPNGEKIPWDDREVVKEELRALNYE